VDLFLRCLALLSPRHRGDDCYGLMGVCFWLVLKHLWILLWQTALISFLAQLRSKSVTTCSRHMTSALEDHFYILFFSEQLWSYHFTYNHDTKLLQTFSVTRALLLLMAKRWIIFQYSLCCFYLSVSVLVASVLQSLVSQLAYVFSFHSLFV
jgi:hypothetical protein